MKRLLLVLVIMAFAFPALAVDAIWNHSDTASVFRYRLYWGTTPGSYSSTQEMARSACAGGTAPDGSPYDCRMTIAGVFVDGVTYYFAASAFNYAADGSLQESDKTPEVVYIKRPPGQTGPKPAPQKNLGIYDSVP